MRIPVGGYIEEYILHYAQLLDDETVLGIMKKRSVDSEAEAKMMLGFLDRMLDQAALDESKKVVVIRQIADAYDAVKVSSLVHDYLSGIGYDHLIE